jgi:hypothetical protein
MAARGQALRSALNAFMFDGRLTDHIMNPKTLERLISQLSREFSSFIDKI